MPKSSHMEASDTTSSATLNSLALQSPAISKCTPHTVTPQELRLTNRLYRDLASRSGGTAIDKTTFLLFFPLPVPCTQGLWGERLFLRFDRKQKGRIDYEDFATGLSICTKSSHEEKLRFLFSLYDLRDDGHIDRAELVTMVRPRQLYSTYRHTIRNPKALEVEVDLPEETKEVLSSKESVGSIRRTSAVLIHRDDSMLPDQMEDLSKQIMSKLEAGDRLNFEQFARFLEQHPRIMEVFTSVFHEEVWAKRTQELHAHVTNRGLSCICFDRGSVVPVSPRSSLTQPEKKEGWLQQRSRPNDNIKRVFAKVKGNILLLCSSPEAPLASSVVFLEGCFIDPLLEFTQGQEHGFSITHQFEGFHPISFWTSSKSDRDTWVLRLRMVAKSRRMEDYYELRERLGSGKFSDVYSAIERETGYSWAIKMIEKKSLNDSEREMLRSEIAIMKLLNHPNVVEMKEVFEDKSYVYVVMELVEGGELFERIRKKRVFSEYMAYHITKQLLETVKYLHDVGIVHRDIKPENILLSDTSDLPTIKLADFGLSKLVGPDDLLTVPCGTLAYVAPEVLMSNPYGKTVDIWSIGVVCYLMVRGRLPFDSKDKQTLIEKTIEAKLDLTGPCWIKLTNYVKDFLGQMLCKDVAQRLTCEQALSHSWVKNGAVLIPRKINRKAMEEDLMTNTLTNARIGSGIYDEHSKAAHTLDSVLERFDRVIYTTPDIYEDMAVERHIAENRIQLS